MAPTIDQSANHEEYEKIVREFRIAGATALLVIGTGTVFYHFTEDLGWVDAFYFSVVTLATVGYGDIVPHTDAGKIFTAFYILIGFGIIAGFASILVRHAVARRQHKRKRRK